MEQIRKNRKRLVALGTIIGGVLVVGTALLLALGSGHRKVVPSTLEASVPAAPGSPAPQEPLSAAPDATVLPLKTDSSRDTETPGTPSPGSLDVQTPLQVAMPSDPQPDAAAETPPETDPVSQSEISEPPPARTPVWEKYPASKPKKAKHASSKVRRHSHPKKTYVTVFPERRNYHYGFPAVSN